MDNPNTITHITNTNTEQSLYERDFYQWGLYNAELLRQGRFAEIDVENIAEEIEGMSRSYKRELFSRLSVLITHLLKWQYQYKKRSRSWSKTVYTQRREIKIVLKFSPSLKYNIEIIINDAFEDAKFEFEKQTKISKDILPAICPYTFKQLSDYDFWPEETPVETIV
ncbi:MAG: DUF29 domain-containing protein [Candidatus Magnetoovum sp. WYHC-5]|nr:DUF29 domain-containing protein [Candidatus Magnetoovum sp. WYHC-5]